MTVRPPALQAIEWLPAAADKLAYYTSSSTAALATFTSFARTLVDDATAAEARATLGFGSITEIITATRSLAVPSEFANAQAAVDYLDSALVLGDPAITMQVTGHVTVATTIAALNTPNSGRLLIRGATPLSKTITNVFSRSGSAGAYSVTLTLNNVSGLDASGGDVALIQGVTPGLPVGGPGTVTTRPVFGALQNSFFKIGELSATGTAATLSGAGAATYMANGDIVYAKGEVFSISGLATSAFTLSQAPTLDFSGLQYWWHCRPATGTITIAGTAVTGTGTSFTTELNVGDIIFPVGSGPARITAITDNTNATINHSLTVGAGVAFGVKTHGEYHEGAWVIDSVDVPNSRITLTNTCRSLAVPPINNVAGGNVYILTSVLKTTNGSGFKIGPFGQPDFQNIGIIVDGAAASVAIDLRGSDGTRAGRAKLGDRVGLNNAGYASRGTTGSVLYGDGIFCSNCKTRGIDLADGAEAYLASVTASGNVGIGYFVGAGCFARLADARSLGNSLQGIRKEVGSSMWGDFAYCEGNGGAGLLDVGGVYTHAVGMWLLNNTGDGYNGQNGGDGRATGALILCNTSRGINTSESKLEASQAAVGGNASDGIQVSRESITLTNGASGYNGGDGIEAIDNDVFCEDFTFVGNTSAQLRASDKSEIWAANTGFGNEGLLGIFATDGADVYVEGYTGSPTLNITVNQVQADGTVIRDGTTTYIPYAHTVNLNAKIGATAGWVLSAAADTFLMATLPAGQTASTLIVPLPVFRVGDVITSFNLVGQIESGGNTATLDATLKKMTAVAAGSTTATIQAMTQISVTADTKVDTANSATTLGTPETVGQDETFYMLITGTTAAATDIELLGVSVFSRGPA